MLGSINQFDRVTKENLSLQDPRLNEMPGVKIMQARAGLTTYAYLYMAPVAPYTPQAFRESLAEARHKPHLTGDIPQPERLVDVCVNGKSKEAVRVVTGAFAVKNMGVGGTVDKVEWHVKIPHTVELDRMLDMVALCNMSDGKGWRAVEATDLGWQFAIHASDGVISGKVGVPVPGLCADGHDVVLAFGLRRPQQTRRRTPVSGMNSEMSLGSNSGARVSEATDIWDRFFSFGTARSGRWNTLRKKTASGHLSRIRAHGKRTVLCCISASAKAARPSCHRRNQIRWYAWSYPTSSWSVHQGTCLCCFRRRPGFQKKENMPVQRCTLASTPYWMHLW